MTTMLHSIMPILSAAVSLVAGSYALWLLIADARQGNPHTAWEWAGTVALLSLGVVVVPLGLWAGPDFRDLIGRLVVMVLGLSFAFTVAHESPTAKRAGRERTNSR